MALLQDAGGRRGRRAFCSHLVDARTARGVIPRAGDPPVQEQELPPLLAWSCWGKGALARVLAALLRSARCTRSAVHACVQHVDGSTGGTERRRFGWWSEQEQPQMLLFTLFSHSAEQRAGGCQQLWGTRRSPCSPAQPIQGLEQTGHRSADIAHLYSDGTRCQQPVRQA